MAAIKLGNGFDITAKMPVDTRLVLTKAEMKGVKFSNMPEIYLCLCSEDKKFYIFDKNIPEEEEDPIIGCFRPLENYLNYDTPEAQELLDSIMANLIKSGSETSKKAVEDVVDEKIETLKIDGQIIK